MTDAALVFPPGFRVLDSDGDPVSGAQIRFFDAGTTTPKTVYSDAALSVSLGSIVYTRSDGFPVAAQNSSTTVAVYLGSAAYKVDILDADGVTIWPAKDNQKGAVDTSDFLKSSDTSSVVIPTVALAVDSSISTTYTGKLINASGNPTLTLAAPATLGDGWNVRIRCSDTGYVKIVAASGAIKGSGFSVAGLSIVGLGATLELACDGANIYVCGLVRAVAAANGRVWTIASRVSAAPATTPGSFYIVSAAFGAFATGDIIEATGQATFIGYTPPSNCGWLAYVSGESLLYQWQASAWTAVFLAASQMPVGTICNRAYAEYATNADLSTVIPLDDTIPQITEGTEIVTATITPKTITNRIRVTFNCMANSGSGAAITQKAIAALFQDATANALFAKAVNVAEGSGSSNTVVNAITGNLSFVYEFVPATTSLITLRVRVGGDANTIRLNGSSAARYFGGVSKATLLLEEIVA